MKVPGTLVVAGDFNNAVTLNISREKLSDLNLPQSFTRAQQQGDSGQQQFLAGAAYAAANQPNIFEFELMSSTVRTDAKGVVYCDLEYTDSICKGDVIEGLKGRRRCSSHAPEPRKAPVHRSIQCSPEFTRVCLEHCVDVTSCATDPNVPAQPQVRAKQSCCRHHNGQPVSYSELLAATVHQLCLYSCSA